MVRRREEIRAAKLNGSRDRSVRGTPVAFLAGNDYDYVGLSTTFFILNMSSVGIGTAAD